MAVVAVLIVATATVYWFQQPDTGDAGYLAPTSTGPIGGSRLAGLLAAKGVAIQQTTTSSDALVAAHAGNATLFVPAPRYMHKYYLRMLKLLPASTRVVLVAPDQRVLGTGRLPAAVADTRIAPRTGVPDCDLPTVRDAGTATVVRTTYLAGAEPGGAQPRFCYQGAVVSLFRGAAEITLVGANEPFRNDRIDEHSNARLAVGVLSTTPKVIWLDRHRPEQPPQFIDDPRLSEAPDAPPSLGPGGSGDPDFPIPGGSLPGEPGQPRLPRAEQTDQQAEPPNPLWQAFPQWTYAAAALLAIAAILLAVASARRLGTPVAEPLPVTVRAAETVEGRGRLYRRAKARGHALAALRDSEIDRLRHLLDLPATSSARELVDAAAAQSGLPPQDVYDALYGAEPDDDEALVRGARRLDQLRDAVLRKEGPPINVLRGIGGPS